MVMESLWLCSVCGILFVSSDRHWRVFCYDSKVVVLGHGTIPAATCTATAHHLPSFCLTSPTIAPLTVGNISYVYIVW